MERLINQLTEPALRSFRCPAKKEKMKFMIVCIIVIFISTVINADSDNCTVPFLPHGDIGEQQNGEFYWDWITFRYKREMKFIKIPPGTVVPFGNSRNLICHEGYSFQGTRNITKEITCRNSHWLPEPVCLALLGGCFLKNLNYSAYIDTINTPSVTPSGKRLHVKCLDGYHQTSRQPLCLEGEWNEISDSHCIEKKCTVPPIIQGHIEESILKNSYWNWKTFRYDREMETVKRQTGTVVFPHSSLKLVCNRSSSFQGVEPPMSLRRLSCRRGILMPFPSCIPNQKEINSTKISPLILTSTTIQPPPTGSRKELSAVVEKLPNPEEKIPVEECFCDYSINDENLVGNVDGKRLKFHDKVKEGSVVKFHCQHEGFHRLNGTQEIRCENCRNWHSSEIPSCIETGIEINCPRLTAGKTFLVVYSNGTKFNSTAHIYCRNITKRILGTHKRTCLSTGQWSGTNPTCEDIICPQFPVMDDLSVSYSNGRKLRSTATFKCSHSMVLVGSQSSICQRKGTWSDPMPSCKSTTCPQFLVLNDLSVSYSDGTNFKSTAKFQCSHSAVLVGSQSSTCQRNGTWSDPMPSCERKSCPKFPTFDGLSIYYSDGTDVNSIAVFECSQSGTLIGSTSSICRKNGEWSNPIPSCESKSCPKFPTFDGLSIYYSDGTDVNSIAIFECSQSGTLIGSRSSICRKNGEWSNPIPSCESAPRCQLNKVVSSLLRIEPKKDYYRFGEFITFSCPPGHYLTGEVERTMCLGSTWANDIPECRIREFNPHI